MGDGADIEVTSSRRGIDWQILTVFLAALALRLVYFLNVRDQAYYQVPLLDSAWYHGSALKILREGFWGGEVFFRGPLYSYFVALWYQLFGENPEGPKIVQMFLGSGTCAFLVLAVRQVFDRKVAFVSGVVAALYPTLVFFDGELLATSLGTFLGVVLLYTALRGAEGPSPRRWLVAGLVFGAAALNRPQVLLLGLGLFIWLVTDRARQRRSWLALVLGAAVVILPVTARNAIVGGDPVLIAYQGGVNLYMGNNPEADGRSARLPGWSDPSRDWSTLEEDTRRMAEAEAGRALLPSEESRFWTAKALAFFRQQPERAAGLIARKTYYLLSGFEIPNNKDLYFFKQYSPLLDALLWRRGLAFPTGLLIPLAALGLVLSAAHPRRYVVFYLFLLCQSLAIVLFFTCARFRVVIVPAVIPFAVWGVRELARYFRRGPRSTGAVAAGIGIAFLVVSNSDFLAVSATARWQDYYDLGLVHAQKHDYAQAREAFEEALRLKGDEVPVLYNLGLVHMNLGRFERAIQYFRTALAIEPGMLSARNNLGICLGQLGRIEEAELEFLRILDVDPGHPEARANLRRIEQLTREEP